MALNNVLIKVTLNDAARKRYKDTTIFPEYAKNDCFFPAVVRAILFLWDTVPFDRTACGFAASPPASTSLSSTVAVEPK
jgi:hypothetical protein